MDEMFDKVDITTWLPYGEQLRVLLSGDHISTGEVSALARSKGLFASNLDRAHLIQFLSTTLIQPRELEQLIDSAVSRESKPKEQPQKVRLTAAGSQWQTAVERLEGEFVDVAGLDSVPGVSFASEPTIRKVDRNHLVVSYEINREDYSRDLLHRELSFKAEISIRQTEGELVLDVLSTHTAKETDRINDRIMKYVTAELQRAGISEDSAPEKIYLGSFDGNGHVTFLLRLAGPGTVGTEPGRIVDLTIKPNHARQDAELPPELKLLEGSIRNVRMDGDKLNEISLLADERYHGSFLMTRVVVEQAFEQAGIKGTCTVSYMFQVARGSNDHVRAPFSFGIEGISINGARKSEQQQKAKKALTAAILAGVDRHFNTLRAR
ncbi:hypothetical protein P3W24_18305 [Luteibacter sp. PPL201]|uniref:GAPS4b N-terminal domain-containing protein n=1 Tax=Luteibacter sahnii TaxID=3021977 RepID=A0ABT6BFM4_9GAMM